MRIGIFPANCRRNLQTSLCNANTVLRPIHTERKRIAKNQRTSALYQRKYSLSRSLSLRVNGPLLEWLCRLDNRVEFCSL